MIVLTNISTNSKVYFPDTLFADDHKIELDESSSNKISIDGVDYLFDSESFDSKAWSYYTGVEANNPTGLDNLKQVVYKRDGITVKSLDYSFDENDNMVGEVRI